MNPAELQVLASPAAERGRRPCLPIQADLSAMLDGELDPASIRRVLVHSDVCPACKAFLGGIRTSMRAHRDLASRFGLDAARGAQGDPVEGRDSAAALRQQLIGNRWQLARILYELGRAHVLMGLSPGFSRVVAREPVPIPDMSLRGRHLLAEVTRLAGGSSAPEEWVRAKELFGSDDLRSPVENLKKGKRLLHEALMLRPDFHEARIYLGHAYHVAGDREQARVVFEKVLEDTEDENTRAFALENLGNVYLEEGRVNESIHFFDAVVHSGVIGREPRFFTCYFNLALAYGLVEKFDECRTWLSRLFHEFPHKRRLIGTEFGKRERFAQVLQAHPEVARSLAADFPGWFPLFS